MVDALVNEIRMRKNYLGEESVSTIYFGGGTPSLIGPKNLQLIIDVISGNIKLENEIELTVECNPDDLDPGTLNDLKSIGVNRLSIGIQSFDEKVLQFMNRAHNAKEAVNCLVNSKNAGFENITIDLIYGVPDTPAKYWEKQLNKMVEFDIPHLSAYCLTIEENTVFGNWAKKGKLNPVKDEKGIREFQYLMDRMNQEGYEQYEISNFCRENFISQHNSAYWLGKKYLGIGPSAHSYDGTTRQWNVANNIKYLKAIQSGSDYFEKEKLSLTDRYNDYILTRLRTKWGINLDQLKSIHPNISKEIFQQHIDKGDLIQMENEIYLTDQGKYIADSISADLFL